ncbi:MAG: class I SAM-dependent methyltransferase [Actinomycetota bacterium]
MRHPWAHAEAYESYVGRWSRLVATTFLEWLGARPSAAWLDLGCGTGALTDAILKQTAPSTVRGEDPSEAQIAYARRHVVDPKVWFAIGNAMAIASPDDSYDYVVSALALNFIPDLSKGMAEMKRVTREGGSIAGYVWDYANGMELLRYFWDVATELDSTAKDLHEGIRFPICAPEPLQDLCARAGLRNIEVVPIDVRTTFVDFDDYWSPFLGGQGPAPEYTMSLPEVERDRLRDLLNERLPKEPDLTIRLTARAWAFRARHDSLIPLE